MAAILNNYELFETLGKGGYSKVKLGRHMETHNLYAIKLIKKVSPRIDMKNLEMILTEVNMLTKVQHPNIVNVIEFGNDGVVKKVNKKDLLVSYVVLELAQGGELFDYISKTGKFTELVARYFFR